MEIYETIFRFLYNILSVYVGYRTIELFLVSKKVQWEKKFCLYFIVWLINSLLYVFSTGIVVVRISIIIGYLCFAFILYEGSWKMKILATVGAFALGLLSEDVVWIFSNLIGKPIEEEAMGCLCSGIFALLLLLLLERLKVFTKRASIPASGCWNLILLFLGSVFLAEIVTERMESYEWTMISLELICMINLGTYHIYHKVVENYEERIEKAEILQENNDMILYMDKIEKIRQAFLNEKFKGKRRLDLHVTYIWGATGRGKTRSIMDAYGDSNVYRVIENGGGHPFDQYDGHAVMVFEEFRSSFKISDMLNYLDVYPVTLPARYCNKVVCYNRVFITTNIPLEDQYTEVQKESPETWAAFLRRIHEVQVYLEDGTIMKYDSVEKYLNRNKEFHKLEPADECPFK